MEKNKIYCGDCLEVMKGFPDDSVDCVVTSPPYYGLRQYGKYVSVWEDDASKIVKPHEHDFTIDTKGGDIRFRGENANVGNNKNKELWSGSGSGSFCSKCGAWRGQLGLEPTLKLYLQHLRMIFAEVYRVLKPTGTVWVNMGDSYVGTGGNAKESDGGQGHNSCVGSTSPMAADKNGRYARIKEMKKFILQKSLMNIPSRFAIMMTDELQFIQRNEIIWYKRNCMPSSASDRFTVDFEKVFFFVKSKKYYFEQQFEEYKNDLDRWGGDLLTDRGKSTWSEGTGQPLYRDRNLRPNGLGRNKRCVWDITTRGYKDAHFATFPEALVVPMIKAGCPEFICKKCGKAREKIVADAVTEAGEKKMIKLSGYGSKTAVEQGVSPTSSLLTKQVKEKSFNGYTDCGCNAGFSPGVVMDIFAGSGTVGEVGKKFGRDWIMIEQNEKYIPMIEERLHFLI